MNSNQRPPGDAQGPALESAEFIDASHTVLRLGRALLASGAGSYRVKDSMRTLAHALGIDGLQAHVTLTEITATSRESSASRTEVIEHRRVGVNADRLEALTTLIRELPATITADEVNRELDRIEGLAFRYPRSINSLAAGLACAAFAFLNGGDLVVCLAVLIAATMGQALRRSLLHRGLNQFGVTAGSAVLAASVYIGVIRLAELAQWAQSFHEAGMISAVLFLVPGFPLVTAILDLVRLDISAGVSRLAYAAMILLSTGMAVWVVSTVWGLDTTVVRNWTLTPLTWVLVAVTSAIAAAGFAVLFNAPPRTVWITAGVAAVANLGRFAMAEAGVTLHLAALIAALVVGLCAAALTGPSSTSRVTLSVPAVVIMIPGVSAYQSLMGFANGEMTAALAAGAQALAVVVGIGVGLAAARMLTDPRWRYDR